MKRILFVLLVVIVSVFLAACGSGGSGSGDQGEVSGPYLPDQRAEAYAYTHGGYVGKAVVTVGADGSLGVDIDEAFLPHTLALVDIESDQWSEANTVSYVSHGSENHVAKYVQYNDKLYVGVSTGDTFSTFHVLGTSIGTDFATGLVHGLVHIPNPIMLLTMTTTDATTTTSKVRIDDTPVFHVTYVCIKSTSLFSMCYSVHP